MASPNSPSPQAPAPAPGSVTTTKIGQQSTATTEKQSIATTEQQPTTKIEQQPTSKTEQQPTPKIEKQSTATTEQQPTPKIEKQSTATTEQQPTLNIEPRTTDVEQLGFKVLYEPQPADTIDFDIVAIHGLAANPDLTWKHRISKVNWLSDPEMLPKTMSRARILRYGYDSNWYGPDAVKQRLTRIANDMLESLCGEREGCENRPMIFIGHCFGGLVMQKAYVIAKANAFDFDGIAASTAGMIFLGTPHRGTGPALHSQGQIYQAIVTRANLETHEGVLRTLEEGNETLVDVVREFTRLVNVPPSKVDIFCFYEQRSTTVGMIVKDNSIKEFVVDEESGTLHGHRSMGLPLDHFSLSKFRDDKDGNYKAVRRQISKMAKIAVEKAIAESQTKKTAAPSGLPPAMVAALHHQRPVSRVPFGRGVAVLASRDDILGKIENSFAKTLRVVLCGASGNGKTHVAVEYVHKFVDAFPASHVLWVNARTVEQFELSYKAIVDDLRIRSARPDPLKAVHRHLGQEVNGQWLMVLDGLDDGDALILDTAETAPGSKGKGKGNGKSLSLLDYVPSTPSGRVLVTTRSMSLASNFINRKSEYIIEVGPTLSDDDAALLLNGHAVTKDAAKKAVAVELSHALARSPMAIALASAYIRASGCSIRTYLGLLQQRGGGKDSAPPGQQDKKAEAQAAAENTFQISCELLKEKHPESLRRLLELGTPPDLQAMPYFVLARRTEKKTQLDEQVAVLATYELARQSETRTAVSTTPLVQVFVRRWLVSCATSNEMTDWADESVLDLVTAAFPDVEKTEEFETAEILRPSAIAVLKLAKSKSTARKGDRALLLQRLAVYEKHLGRYEVALRHLEECLVLREEAGDAALIEEVKKATEAIREERRRAESAPEVAVVDRGAAPASPGQAASQRWDRVSGQVRSVVRMATTPKSPEQHREAVLRVKLELEAFEKTLSPDHESALRKVDELATALHGNDSTGESIGLRQRVAEWCERVYGPHSLDTVRQTYNLGLAHEALGQIDEATTQYHAALKAAESLLAPGSPELLRILGSLAVALAVQGRTREAEEALRVALAGQQDRLGPDHPETLATRQNAALLAQEAGKVDAAGKDLVHVLRAQERLLGPDDPATLRTTASLALNQRLAGRPAEAQALFRLALEGQVKALGASHPETLDTQFMLAELLQAEGHLPEAKREYTAVWEGRKTVWGKKHPHTLAARKRLEAMK